MKMVLACFFVLVTFTSLAFSEDNIQEVVAEGVGATEREAVTEAFRNAIEESIGLYVDSETKMKNEELISDNILTVSKGYIHKYRITSSSTENGLTKVTIKALVKMQDVKTSLTGLNISILSTEDMANTHARLSSKLTRSQDAEKILLKTLDDFFSDENILDMLEVKLDGFVIHEDELSQDNTVPFEVSFNIAFNLEKYNTRIKELTTVFKNIGGTLEKTIPVVTQEEARELQKLLRQNRDRRKEPNEFYEYYKKLQRPNDKFVDKVYFGLIRYDEPAYKLDHYSFPKEWETIYPWNMNWKVAQIKQKRRILKNLEVIIQFKNEETIVLERKPRFNRYGELQNGGPPEVLKVAWRSNPYANTITQPGSAWSRNAHYSSFNIGPYVYSNTRLAEKYTYKDNISVDLLYDITNVEVKIEMKEQ